MSLIDPLRTALASLVREAVADALRVHDGGNALEARIERNRAMTERDELAHELAELKRRTPSPSPSPSPAQLPGPLPGPRGAADPDRPTIAELHDRRAAEELAAIERNRAARGDVPSTLTRQRKASESKRLAALAREAAKRGEPPPAPPAPIEPPPRVADRRDAHTAAGKSACGACGAVAGDPCVGTGRPSVYHPERYEAGRVLLARRNQALAIVCPTCAAAAGDFCIVQGNRGVHGTRYPAAS